MYTQTYKVFSDLHTTFNGHFTRDYVIWSKVNLPPYTFIDSTLHSALIDLDNSLQQVIHLFETAKGKSEIAKIIQDCNNSSDHKAQSLGVFCKVVALGYNNANLPFLSPYQWLDIKAAHYYGLDKPLLDVGTMGMYRTRTTFKGAMIVLTDIEIALMFGVIIDMSGLSMLLSNTDRLVNFSAIYALKG
jgi:hypothetical protein